MDQSTRQIDSVRLSLYLLPHEQPARGDDAQFVAEQRRAAAAVAERLEGASPLRLHAGVPPGGDSVPIGIERRRIGDFRSGLTAAPHSLRLGPGRRSGSSSSAWRSLEPGETTAPERPGAVRCGITERHREHAAARAPAAQAGRAPARGRPRRRPRAPSRRARRRRASGPPRRASGPRARESKLMAAVTRGGTFGRSAIMGEVGCYSAATRVLVGC